MAKVKDPRAYSRFDVAFKSDTGDLCDMHYSKPDPSKNAPWYQNSIMWQPNAIFSDVLQYTGCYKSGAYFKSLKSKRNYKMFLSDFDVVIKNKKLNGDTITGEFFFCRKGVMQGIKLIIE